MSARVTWIDALPGCRKRIQITFMSLENDDVEHVAVRRVGESGPEIPAPAGGRNWGCLVPLLLWALGWVATAWLAVRRLGEGPDLGALLGVLVSGFVSLLACRLLIALVRGRNALAMINVSGSVPLLQRGRNWFIWLVWCAVAVAWNVAVFSGLINAARRGAGFLLLFMTFWSVAGLVLLGIVILGGTFVLNAVGSGLRRS
jgi:hypothetical protein